MEDTRWPIEKLQQQKKCVKRESLSDKKVTKLDQQVKHKPLKIKSKDNMNILSSSSSDFIVGLRLYKVAFVFSSQTANGEVVEGGKFKYFHSH